MNNKVMTLDKEVKLCDCFQDHSPVHPLRFSGNTYRTGVCSDAVCVALSYSRLSVKMLTCLSTSLFDSTNTSFCVVSLTFSTVASLCFY